MIDINKPVTNDNLVKAMRIMQENQTPDNEKKLINELFKANFLVPVIFDPDLKKANSQSGEIELKKDTVISFETLEWEDKYYFQVYTDWEELYKWKYQPNQQTLVISYKEISEFIINQGKDGFVINPFSDNFVLSKNQLMSQSQPVKCESYIVEESTRVSLGIPKKYPKKMIKELKKYLSKQQNIKKAYFMLMEKNEKFSYLLVIDFIGDKDEVFNGIANVAIPYSNGYYINMIPYNSDFGVSTVKEKSPFYERK